MRRLPLLMLPVLLLLGACQSQQINRDFDASRDFASYRSWSWQEPAVQYKPDDPRIRSDLTEQRLRSAVADQLDQRGLRPAAGGAQGDLKVQVWLVVEDRQQQVSSGFGGGFGGYWGPYWGGPTYNETRTLDYKVATVQVDLFDGKDGKLVWRGSDERIVRDAAGNPAEREAQIRETVGRILGQYPPR